MLLYIFKKNQKFWASKYTVNLQHTEKVYTCGALHVIFNRYQHLLVLKSFSAVFFAHHIAQLFK